MARASIGSVDEYIGQQPTDVQSTLRRVRRAIRKAIPEAEESITYQMPTYRLGGKAVLYFAGWREHYSLYPATASLVRALKAELTPLVVRKGTIRLPYSGAVPTKLIGAIAKLRAREVRALAGATTGAPKKVAPTGVEPRVRSGGQGAPAPRGGSRGSW